MVFTGDGRCGEMPSGGTGGQGEAGRVGDEWDLK
jgi:hypothetical protein